MHFLTPIPLFTFLRLAASQSATPTLPNVVGPAPSNIGNASDIKTYPLCAVSPNSQPPQIPELTISIQQTCSNATAISLGPISFSTAFDCGPQFRSMTAECEKVTCSDADYNSQYLTILLERYKNKGVIMANAPSHCTATQTLAQQLCGPFYTNGSIPSSSVAAAIASATAIADANAGKDPFDIGSYPACAVRQPYLYTGRETSRICLMLNQMV